MEAMAVVAEVVVEDTQTGTITIPEATPVNGQEAKTIIQPIPTDTTIQGLEAVF